MKYNVMIIFMMTLMGCGAAGLDGAKGDKGDQGPPGVAASTPAPTDQTQDDINSLVADENTYREGLGQTGLTSGLGCVLYTVTGGDRIQASVSGHNTLTGIIQVASFLYQGWFNQPDGPISSGMNVLPSQLQQYTNMYLLRCQGYVVVTQTDYYQFDTLTDDASVLYVDGSKLVDNDNAHGATDMAGTKYLRRGVHAFRIDYAQTGAGNEALVIKVNGSLIDPRYYFH